MSANLELEIRSGGAPGAALGALLGAMDARLPYSGWYPKGKGDGVMHLAAALPLLTEAPTSDLVETRCLNLNDCNAAIIVVPDPKRPPERFRWTVDECGRRSLPCRFVAPDRVKAIIFNVVSNMRPECLVRLYVSGEGESDGIGLRDQVRVGVIDAAVELRKKFLLRP